jgi:hypothetical protein
MLFGTYCQESRIEKTVVYNSQLNFLNTTDTYM